MKYKLLFLGTGKKNKKAPKGTKKIHKNKKINFMRFMVISSDYS